MKSWFKGFNINRYYRKEYNKRKEHEEICLKCPYTRNCTKDTGGTYSCRFSRAYKELKAREGW